MAINWIALIASMLVSAKAQADAEKKGLAQMNVANQRRDAEQSKIDAIMKQNLEQYENAKEQEAMDEIIKEKVAPAIKAIDSTTNFQDVNRYGSDGNVQNTAYKDALTGAINEVAENAKTKADMLAKVKAPTHMRKDQSVNTADAMQRQGVIGKNATDWYNNVSKVKINNAFKPNSGMMLLSKALGAYATMGADGGASGTVTPVEVVDKSHLINPTTSLYKAGNATGGLFT